MPVLEGALPIEIPYDDSPEPMQAPVYLSTITTAAELAEIADDWNRVAGEIPFRRHEWLATWWRHFSTSKAKLMVVALREKNGRLAGAMPWYLDRSLLFGRVLRLLGSGIVCTDYVTLMADSDRGSEYADRVADWLDGDFAGEWDAIHLDEVDAADPAWSALIESLRRQGHLVDRRSGMNCWRIELPATWDEYLSRFSKRRRDRIKNQSRQWFETGKAALHTASNSNELAHAWSILVDLHQRRRQSLGQPGCFADPRFASFLHEATARLFAAGRVRLYWLECEGRPAAAQLDLTGGNVTYGYQMGMDPDLASYEPGNLRMTHVLRQAIEEGFRSFDLLRGDESYKATWQAKPVPLVRWRVVNKHFAARCRHRVWLGSEFARGWARFARDQWTRQKRAETAAASSPHDAKNSAKNTMAATG